MTTPVVAQKGPYVKDEEAKKYWWCACGLSKNQPYCDGSHKGTGLHSCACELTEKKRVAWCGCKQTKTPPFCDGSHSRL